MRPRPQVNSAPSALAARTTPSHASTATACGASPAPQPSSTQLPPLAFGSGVGAGALPSSHTLPSALAATTKPLPALQSMQPSRTRAGVGGQRSGAQPDHTHTPPELSSAQKGPTSTLALRKTAPVPFGTLQGAG